jgi:hypothetical protein
MSLGVARRRNDSFVEDPLAAGLRTGDFLAGTQRIVGGDARVAMGAPEWDRFFEVTSLEVGVADRTVVGTHAGEDLAGDFTTIELRRTVVSERMQRSAPRL